VHPTLDGDVRISQTRGDQLPDRAQPERVGGRDIALTAALEEVLELLEDGVLKDGVDDEDQRGEDAREEGFQTALLEEGSDFPDRARGLGLTRAGGIREGGFGRGGGSGGSGGGTGGGRGGALARGHARVDDPDWVSDEYCRGASDRSGDHRLHSRQLATAASLDRGFLEGAAGPFIPCDPGESACESRKRKRTGRGGNLSNERTIVVDEVGDGNAKDGRIEPRV
jgi:hypothetical protein